VKAGWRNRGWLEIAANDKGKRLTIKRTYKLDVEDEILEFAPLDGHEHRAVSGGDGRQDALPTRTQRERIPVAGADTHAAAQANVLPHLRLLALGMARVAGRDQAHGLHGAGLDALSATVAVGVFHFGQEVGGGDGAEGRATLRGKQGFAAAAAAIADESTCSLTFSPN
jgi:hypothetical protein